jgi:hypothetical protein
VSITSARDSLLDDLFLPTLLFVALGAMTWAVRGCSGFGASNGCLFAGVTWGTAWWFIAREPHRTQSRRYASGWVVLAMAAGFAIAGDRGWMQWPSFFNGRLQTNTPAEEFVAIPRTYGFVWLFIAGVPWAGLAACFLAWCGAGQSNRLRDWSLRIACGLAGAGAAALLFDHFPQLFLPLYAQLKPQYADHLHNPNLARLINDNRAALIHLGAYLGFLGHELGRRDWLNVKLILTVGLVTGAGWAAWQNWSWAPRVWPHIRFNWWRCWESCGGISIGAAYGLAYYLVNRRSAATSIAPHAGCPGTSHPNLERFVTYAALLVGLGISLKNGFKGWANIYLGNEEHWNRVLWAFIGPALLAGLAALAILVWRRPIPRGSKQDLFPHAARLTWLMLLIQNFIAQLITGPRTDVSEAAFSVYYLALFVISALILRHYAQAKLAPGAPVETQPALFG